MIWPRVLYGLVPRREVRAVLPPPVRQPTVPPVAAKERAP